MQEGHIHIEIASRLHKRIKVHFAPLKYIDLCPYISGYSRGIVRPWNGTRCVEIIQRDWPHCSGGGHGCRKYTLPASVPLETTSSPLFLSTTVSTHLRNAGKSDNRKKYAQACCAIFYLHRRRELWTQEERRPLLMSSLCTRPLLALNDSNDLTDESQE